MPNWLLLVAAPLHSMGLRISLYFSSWRRDTVGKSWHVSAGTLLPHLLCGFAVFLWKEFFLPFFFCFCRFFLFCLLGANRIINQPHQRNRICLTESGHQFPWTVMTLNISPSCDDVNWYGFLIIFIFLLTWLLIISIVYNWGEMNWFWILGWLSSVFAIVGNALVVCLILTRRKLRTNPNFFIVSLAFADLGVGACYFPAQFLCDYLSLKCFKGIYDIAVFMIFCSTASLCSMTLDRYLAIVKPFSYATVMTRRRVLYLIATSWVVPFMVYFVPSFCNSLGRCSINHEVTVIIWTSMFEFIPCVVLVIATVKIVSSVRKYYQRMENLHSQLRYNEPRRKAPRLPKLSTAHVIITVVICFLVCYSFEVCSSLCYFTKLCKITDNLLKVVFFLVATNSAMNPFAYALLKKDIQRELKALLFRTKFGV